MKLRDYQRNCAEAVLQAWREAVATLVVMPTGTGKTVLFADLIRRAFPRRAMVLAHREELIWQAREPAGSGGDFGCAGEEWVE